MTFIGSRRDDQHNTFSWAYDKIVSCTLTASSSCYQIRMKMCVFVSSWQHNSILKQLNIMIRIMVMIVMIVKVISIIIIFDPVLKQLQINLLLIE